MAISSRQQLADFILSQLGAPVINIEVADSQLEDNIELAVEFYIEKHFDGIEREYLSHVITGTQVTVADGSIFKPNEPVTSMDGKTSAGIVSINGNILTTSKQLGFVRFAVGDTVKNNAGVTTTVSAITLGDVDNGWIPVSERVMGVIKILNITSILGSADYMFNAQYQIMMSEIQNLTSAGTAYFYGVQQFLGHLDFIMKKEKDFRFNRRAGELFLDIAWTTDVKVGDIVIAEIYISSDDETYPRVLNDIWLKKYATALVKKQWGTNLRKYEGMQLPGGVTFNGQKIHDEAVIEIEKLEVEAISMSAPLGFMVG